jgi:hypothetical protein
VTRSRFDSRTWTEIVGNLVSERTSVGDTIKLTIKFNGNKKPNVWLEFQTYDPDKKNFLSIEEITDWVDDLPYYEIIDDTTGQPIPGEGRRGSSDWTEYVDVRFGPAVQSIVRSGGRRFEYEVINNG